jgi:WD40 repeat protein
MDRGDFEQHKPNCPVKCPQGCGEDVPRSKVTEHNATVCLNVQVPCTAKELGCTDIILRRNLQIHIQECKYEQSRWIIEPLKQEVISLRQHVEQLDDQYQQSLNELNKKYETILQQLPNNVSNLMGDTEHVACGSEDDIEIWNVSTGTRVKVLKGLTNYIYSIIQLSDGTLVSASNDYTIRLWNIETGECTKVHAGHTSYVYCVIQLANGTIASGSHDETICI